MCCVYSSTSHEIWVCVVSLTSTFSQDGRSASLASSSVVVFFLNFVIFVIFYLVSLLTHFRNVFISSYFTYIVDFEILLFLCV